MTRQLFVLVGVIVLMMVSSVEGAQVGDQRTYMANQVVFHMRLAPAATFPTGIIDSGRATVSTPYWIGETEVTYELWYTVRQWAVQNGYVFANAGSEGQHSPQGQEPTAKKNEPVTWVHWLDSIVWTNALSEMLGYEPVYTFQDNVIRDSSNVAAFDYAVQKNTNGFRLPTSDEWELAARYRGNDSSDDAHFIDEMWWTPGTYASGSTADWRNTDALQEVAWYRDNSGRRTHDVGLKLPNGLGLYDMNGNVWEWSFDRNGSSRVFRGGSYASFDGNLQVGSVFGTNPDAAEGEIGFRLVRSDF